MIIKFSDGPLKGTTREFEDFETGKFWLNAETGVLSKITEYKYPFYSIGWISTGITDINGVTSYIPLEAWIKSGEHFLTKQQQ